MKKHRCFSPLAVALVFLAGHAALHAAERAAAVTGLKVTPVTLSRLDLSWDAVEGARGYNVYRSTSKGFVASDENWIASTTENSYCSRELAPATTYWYRAFALVDGKESNASAEAEPKTGQNYLMSLLV